MGQTISGTHTTLLRLTKAAQNPVTVLSSGEIATMDRYAIFGSALQPWTITNLGTLSSARDAIRLTSGGSVTNGGAGALAASISGGSAGVLITGGAGTVANLATISAGANFPSSVGASLADGGIVVNGSVTDSKAVIEGSTGVFVTGGSGTLVNYGHIVGRGGNAVILNDSGTLANGAAGDCRATITGNVAIGGGGNVNNFGTIVGSIAAYSGGFGNFGTITNSGVIRGSLDANLQSYSGGSTVLDNSGTLTGSIHVYGYLLSMSLTNSGTVGGPVSLSGAYTYFTLTNSGRIDGGVSFHGYSGFNGSETLLNTGRITNAGGSGVYMRQPASLTNGSPGATAAIIAGATGVVLGAYGPQTVTNYGKIIGWGGTAVRFMGDYDHLRIAPGAVFVGKVLGSGSATNNGIELASAANGGTLSGLGSRFIDFGRIGVDAGARWTLAGTNALTSGATISLASGGVLTVTGSLSAGPVLALAGSGTLAARAGAIVEVGAAGVAVRGLITVDPGATLVGSGRLAGAISDGGTIEARGGTLRLGGAVSGRGTVAIDTGATLIASNNLNPRAIRFLPGSAETLLLNHPTDVTGRVSGFDVAGSRDRIDLLNFRATGSAFSADTLTLASAGGMATLHFTGSYTLASFHIASDHHNGTNITFA